MHYQLKRTLQFNIHLLFALFLFHGPLASCSSTFQKDSFNTFLDISSLLQQPKSKDILKDGKRIYSAKNAVHDFDNQEIVIPIRLHHETGHPVSHGRHFRRRSRDDNEHLKMRKRRDLGLEQDKEHFLRDLVLRNRRDKNNSHDVRDGTFYDVIPDKYSGESLDFIKEDIGQYLDHSVANYSLKAFGEQFLFHLTPYEDFLAPNYSLRYLADPAKDHPLHPDVPRHCFYAGYVNGKREHKAILSVCSGLFGAFKTDKSDYLIQPETTVSNPSHDNDADEEGTKRHRIFRRSIEENSAHKKRCGYTDTENEHQDNKQRNRNEEVNIERIRKSEKRKYVQSYRRNLEETKRRQRRKVSKIRSLLKFSEVRSNASLSGSILKKLGVSTLVNSRQVLQFLKLHDSLIFNDDSREEENKRRRRYLSYARNVEVMVTADNSMLRLHRDVEHYVLTLMAIVNHVYHDPSVENLINIVVVELVVVGDSQVQNGPSVVSDARKCLTNFCEWQFRHNTPDDSHPSHHDTAVLITGQDICRTEDMCDTLGLAELGTICDMRRSCSINEDNGLSTAFTIAHEIGHELNAPHDNSDKCRDAHGQLGGFNVMARTLDNKAHPWLWSKCSAKYITSFLDNGGGRCLLDEPPRRVMSLPIEEPGEMFNANDQCSFVYGKGVAHCSFMFQNTCKRLWCVSQNITNGCRTPHVPWADGTRCGDRMWCQQGQCVPENRQRIPIDGSWGEWSQFGECSRTCGGGVKSAVRECNNPKPQYGGLYCTGKRKKFRPCNYQECPEGADFRTEQCAEYNNVTGFIHRVQGVPNDATWIPKYDGIPEQDRCKLTCQVRSKTVYSSAWYILKPKVTNGTPCGPDTHDICVEGICKPAGCDHVLNSNAKEDSCGICNGDNTGCRWVEGTYNSGYNIGYNEVIVIPRGATNIVITQQSYSGDANDNNYLALRDSHGSYILNGNRSVMRKIHRMQRRINHLLNKYAYYCDYSGTNQATETINCSKAIGIDIVVEVLSAGDLMPPNIKYKYKFPVTYRWESGSDWTTCSEACNGRTKKKIQCVRSDEQVVADRKCNHIAKPNYIVRSCNTRCRLEWFPDPLQCSVRCGKGTKNVEYKCYKVTSGFDDNTTSNNHERELVSDSMCPSPKPANGVAQCQGDCLPTRWQYEKWGECSATCGTGSQTRLGSCRDSKGSHFPPDQCEEVAVLSRTCSRAVCPQWYTSSVGQCSASCGSGVQRQRVWCGARGALRSEDECDSSAKPSHLAPCNIQECPVWKYGEWERCSVTCGEGTSRRSYQCVNGRRTHERSSCDPSLLRITRSCSASRSCHVGWSSRSSDGGFPSLIQRGLAEQGPFPISTTESPTTTTSPVPIRPRLRSNYNSDTYSDVSVINSRHEVARWRTGSWTPCSQSCDGGIRLRYVSCRHVLSGKEMNDAECGLEQMKPPSREECQTDPCPGIWRTGSWSECSVSCGEGTQSRYVGCLFDGRYERDSVHCLADDKPVEREACSVTTCQATTTPASTTNGIVVTDDVIRPSTSVTSVVDRISTRGRNRTSSDPTPGKWRTGLWSRCSSSCGEGIQKRRVVCSSTPGEPAFCPPKDRPTNQQTCQGRECPAWRHSDWGKCSRTCGGGTRSRRVYCVNSYGRRTYERKCDVMQRSDDASSCNTKQCPAKHRWRKSAWSSCSATCGRGTKTRRVNCIDGRGRVADEDNCATRRRGKPRQVHRCVVQRRCPKWRSGKWGRCSTTCGEGTMVRKVSCKYKRKAIVDQLCDVTKRPDDVKRCTVMQCSTFQWHSMEWNPCSTTCGEGLQERGVMCHSSDDQRIVEDSMCGPVQDKLSAHQACNLGPCAAPWVIGPWSECSRTCGPGMQRRDVTCTYIHPHNYTEIDVDSCDVATKPYDVRDCDRGNCNARYYWRVGSWSECSATCGEGHSVRRVVCSDRVSQSPQDDEVCQAIPSFRPDRTRKCREIPCVPQTCLELKTQQDVTSDGEYFLKVKEKMAKIYCSGMNTTQPSEYLTLASGSEENYSEIFGFRLIDADTCPRNGSRDPDCACHRDHPDEGYTKFERVRFDVSSMRIIASDFTFAKTLFGKPVGFGIAGDCYSRNNCPQGVFRINLKGTSFSISDVTTWLSYGIDSTKRIYKSPGGDVIAGNCGGYCSRCQPDPLNGLLLKHNDRPPPRSLPNTSETSLYVLN